MNDNYAVVLVPQAEVRRVWKLARPHLADAVSRSRGRWKPEYVLAALVLGEQSLWVVMHENEVVGAANTQVVRYPERTMLAIHFLGGENFDGWYKNMLSVLKEYGREAGCDAIECNARFGFWKWFKEDDFEKTSVFYEKLI